MNWEVNCYTNLLFHLFVKIFRLAKVSLCKYLGISKKPAISIDCFLILNVDYFAGKFSLKSSYFKI